MLSNISLSLFSSPETLNIVGKLSMWAKSLGNEGSNRVLFLFIVINFSIFFFHQKIKVVGQRDLWSF